MKEINSTQFDAQLSAIPHLNWLPWIGHHYTHTGGILLLGESFYEDGDGWLKLKEAARNLVQNHGLNSGQPRFSHSKFFRNVEHTCLSKPHSTLAEREALWSATAYLNLVQRPLASRQERPTAHDFDGGWQVVLDVARIIRPKVCVRLGIAGIGRLGRLLATKQTGWQYESTDFNQRPRLIHLQYEDYPLTIVCINHPSGSFGYKYQQWATVLTKAAPTLFPLQV